MFKKIKNWFFLNKLIKIKKYNFQNQFMKLLSLWSDYLSSSTSSIIMSGALEFLDSLPLFKALLVADGLVVDYLVVDYLAGLS